MHPHLAEGYRATSRGWIELLLSCPIRARAPYHGTDESAGPVAGSRINALLCHACWSRFVIKLTANCSRIAHALRRIGVDESCSA